MDQSVKVLLIATEGGGLDFYGRQVDGKWSFKMTMDDCSPLLIDEEPIHFESQWFGSLSKCLAACKYEWNMFVPIEVHPDFAQEIYKLKLAKDKKNGGNERYADRWAEKCVIRSGH